MVKPFKKINFILEIESNCYRWMIGLAYLGCSILSFFWILLMRCMAGIMVWTSIALIFVLVVGLLGYSTYR